MVTPAWKLRLSRAIMADGRSQKQIAEKANLSRNYIGSILKYDREPTVGNLIDLCAVLGVSPAYILAGMDASQETIEIIEALDANPDKRSAILALLDQDKKKLGQKAAS